MFSRFAAALSLVCIWSTTALSIKWSVVGYHYSTALFLRFFPAFIVLLVIARLRRIDLQPDRSSWSAWLTGGGCTIFSMVCTYWASQYVSSGLVAVLFGLSPLLTVILAGVLLHQPIRRAEIVGSVLALSGLATIFSGQLRLGPEGIPALLVILLAVTVNCLGAVKLKIHTQGADTLQLSTGSIGVCALVSAIVWLAYGLPWPEEVSLRATAAAIYLALVGSVFAMSVYFWLIRECRPTQVALIPMIATVSALWCGKVLNDEVLTPAILAGSFLVMAGLALHQLGIFRSR